MCSLFRLRCIELRLHSAAIRFGLAVLLCTIAHTVTAEPSDVLPEPITPLPLSGPPADPRRVTLGARLFNDVRLSGDGSLSCASCHDVTGNGARPASPVPPGKLDTPTVFNAALSFRLNWEGKFRSLEEHAAALLQSPDVMNASIAAVVERLRADPQMLAAFAAAYGGAPDRDSLLDALASYQSTLVTPNSSFDRWLRGDKAALTDDAQRGYRSFKELGCVSCHQGVNVGGNLFQRHGIFAPLASPKPEIVRVPTLRNIAATAPYFHDGSAPNLTDAVRRMGLAHLNEALSDYEVEGLVAFLESLTGEYRGRPVGTAP
jgi:cytochrome c peroxidase